MTERPKTKPDYPGDTSGAGFDYWWCDLGWWTQEKRKPRPKAAK